MHFPLDALVFCNANAVPAGQIYCRGGDWFLSVTAYSSGKAGAAAIGLTGPATGRFIPAPYGEATFVGGAHEFRVMVPTFAPEAAGSEGPWYASLLVGKKMLVPTGAGGSHTIDRFFTLQGLEDSGDGILTGSRRFNRWTVWLARKDGQVLGTAPVLEVNAVS